MYNIFLSMTITETIDGVAEGLLFLLVFGGILPFLWAQYYLGCYLFKPETSETRQQLIKHFTICMWISGCELIGWLVWFMVVFGPSLGFALSISTSMSFIIALALMFWWRDSAIRFDKWKAAQGQ